MVRLEIRLLGELQVLRDGCAATLPASKKTRALLAYLCATQRPQLRERLCALLWDGPDDPRAALRWSLTKIRPLLDDGAVKRLQADRERVAFEPADAFVDLTAVHALVTPSVAQASTEALEAAAGHIRGALLEGLELPDCHRFHEWCVAAREDARHLRLGILAALVERHRAQPENALRWARAWVEADPFVESAHVAVIRILGAMGRAREGIAQYETCKRILEAQLGARASTELELARSNLGKAVEAEPAREAAPEISPPTGGPALAAPALAAPALAAPAPAPLLGRAHERQAIERLVAAAADGGAREVLFYLGDPGIGKSRLLDEVARTTQARGGVALRGRAFEAEMVRPYGPFIDALRSLSLANAPAALREDLAPLLPELSASATAAAFEAGGAGGTETKRNRLFDAVARLLVHLGGEGTPTALLLDDIHWFDEASAALLHYVARAVVGTRVLVALGARPGELDDNAAALKLIRALRGDGRLALFEPHPLGDEDTAKLAQAVGPDLDVSRVFAESGGNPLYTLELAHALARRSDTSDTLEGLILDRLAGLEARARDLLPWAAALGRRFSPETLAAVAGVAIGELLAAIATLERHGVIAPASGMDGEYDFSHDLVRRAAYRQLSEPRRRMVHRQIARVLDGVDDASGTVASDVAHHAALAGEAALCARACVIAGQRCHRVSAFAEADDLAERGLQQLTRLPREARLRLHVELLGLKVRSGLDASVSQALQGSLTAVLLEAQASGLHAEVSTGYYLLSNLHFWSGDFGASHRNTLQSAEAARSADPITTARALASTGRCLVMLDRDLPEAWSLLQEADEIASRRAVDIEDIPLGLGMLHQHVGDSARAVALLERALALSCRAEDCWRQCDCLARLAMIEIDRHAWSAALERCTALAPMAAKMGEGSEVPFAAALDALARFGAAEDGAAEKLEHALAALVVIDSAWMLAYILSSAAGIDLDRGAVAPARTRAEAALGAAERSGRPTEAALAHVQLARAALLIGDRADALRHAQAVEADLGKPLVVAARARSAIAPVAQTLGLPLR